MTSEKTVLPPSNETSGQLVPYPPLDLQVISLSLINLCIMNRRALGGGGGWGGGGRVGIAGQTRKYYYTVNEETYSCKMGAQAVGKI